MSNLCLVLEAGEGIVDSQEPVAANRDHYLCGLALQPRHLDCAGVPNRALGPHHLA